MFSVAELSVLRCWGFVSPFAGMTTCVRRAVVIGLKPQIASVHGAIAWVWERARRLLAEHEDASEENAWGGGRHSVGQHGPVLQEPNVQLIASSPAAVSDKGIPGFLLP